jgi:molybdopterin-guanine dinucleotide biosynthesis protein A
MRLLGAVLAGGQSRRFGSDKALAAWKNRPLIDHVIGTLRPHVDTILICGREWNEEISALDIPEPGRGPLGGLNAAMAYATCHGLDRVLSVPCDVPTLPDSLLRRLTACDEPTYLQEHPVIGIWPSALAATLDRHLAGNIRGSMREWTGLIAAGSTRLLEGEQLPNINRTTDLIALGPHG